MENKTKEERVKQRQVDAFNFLNQADLFFGDSGFDEGVLPPEEEEKWTRMLNLNDTFGWGCSDCELVEMEDMPELKRLFFRYGWCGILYWVSEVRGGQKPEFHHYSRMIDFVRSEESIRKTYGDSISRYAYGKHTYTVGKIEGE